MRTLTFVTKKMSNWNSLCPTFIYIRRQKRNNILQNNAARFKSSDCANDGTSDW